MSAAPRGRRRPPAPGRLLRKYVVLFASLVSVALLAHGLVELWFVYRDHTAVLLRVQREQAESAATKIGQFVEEIEAQLGWTTHFAWDNGAPEARRLDALRLLRQVPAVTELAQVDGKGREQLRVSRLALDEVGTGKDVSQEPAFVQAMGRKVYYGPVYFRRDSEPYMTLAVAGARSNAGVSIAEVNLKFILEVVSRIKVGEGGYAYVVDSAGRLIAHPDITLVLRATDLTGLTQVKAARQATQSAAVDLSLAAANLRGERVLAAYAPIEPLEWRVLVELPLDEAFAPLVASAKRTTVLLALGLLAAILAAVLLARRMVVPIKALQAGAARVGGGDLGHKVEVHTGDEVELLANQFNAMSEDLRESRDRAERMGRLRRFLSPQLAQVIESSGGESLLESHRREVTVVFCDLRGFTAFAEAATPENIMAVLNEYHAGLGAIIHEFEGTLERFLGDGALILFNDPLPCPDPSARAVRMAVAMRDCVARLAVGWRQYGPPLGFGLGIAHGTATLGRIGFEGRFDYAVIGSVANLAARLCARAKAGEILVDLTVKESVDDIAELEPVGELALKGIQRPVPAFNVRALRELRREAPVT